MLGSGCCADVGAAAPTATSAAMKATKWHFTSLSFHFYGSPRVTLGGGARTGASSRGARSGRCSRSG